MTPSAFPLATALAPELEFAPELLLKAQGIKVAFFDVDGVLTDGGFDVLHAGPAQAVEREALVSMGFAVGAAV